jgi:NAD(P)-dependent dehydrogenase (short-subunit alcohol dehydrogenase family)
MLLTGGGAILITASVTGLGAAPKMSIYAASHHAEVGFTKSALEYATNGIRVNAVCPAVIDSSMYRRRWLVILKEPRQWLPCTP